MAQRSNYPDSVREFEELRGLNNYVKWLEKIQTLMADQRETLACLNELATRLLEEERALFRHLDHFHAGEGNGQSSEAREQQIEVLRAAYMRARRRQRHAARAFETLLEEFSAIEPVGLPAPLSDRDAIKDEVDQASWESFPASDSPGYTM